MTLNKSRPASQCPTENRQTSPSLQSDRGEGSVEETLPWPGKMASPPEPRETGESALAGSGLAPFGNQQAELASTHSQMSVEGTGDGVRVVQKPVESLWESIMTYYHHNWSYRIRTHGCTVPGWQPLIFSVQTLIEMRGLLSLPPPRPPQHPAPGPIMRYVE